MNSELGIPIHRRAKPGRRGGLESVWGDGRVQRRCLASRFAPNRRAWARSPEVPGIPIRRELACLASSRGSASKNEFRSRNPLPGPLQRKLRTQNSKLKTCLILLAALVMMFVPVLASAKLAVFVDGRVLKVSDARLDGSEIVLELKGGGTVRVSAMRIDRVIADEVEDDASDGFENGDCPYVWSNEPLPRDLPFQESVTIAARTANLHPWLVAAVVQTESAFDPRALSRVGAAGLMQLMPAAAADHGVDDVFDPAENLRGGAEHLRTMLDRFSSLSLALAAYNAGATTVERYDGIPPYKETRDYVRKVLERFCPEE